MAIPTTIIGSLPKPSWRYVSAERLIAAPDCGMVMLDRQTARAKLRTLVQGASMAG